MLWWCIAGALGHSKEDRMTIWLFEEDGSEVMRTLWDCGVRRGRVPDSHLINDNQESYIKGHEFKTLTQYALRIITWKIIDADVFTPGKFCYAMAQKVSDLPYRDNDVGVVDLTY
jgi:hypothetical protein